VLRSRSLQRVERQVVPDALALVMDGLRYRPAHHACRDRAAGDAGIDLTLSARSLRFSAFQKS